MEKLKSIYEWYFKDSIKISSPSLDEGSKRLGKVIAILGGWFVGAGLLREGAGYVKYL